MIARTAVAEAERRDLALVDARIEIREDGEAKRFFGHAAVFNTRTAIGNPLKWGFYEQISPGAFTKTLGESDVRMLIDHDPFYVVSRKSAGTLTLREDSVGLAVDSAMDPDLSYVRDLQANLRNKNTTGMSFGFHVVKDEWSTEDRTLDDGSVVQVEVRDIQEVKLIEVSAVTFPAYEQTDASLAAVRSALAHRGDDEAIRRRVEFRPELADLLERADDPKKPYGNVKYADPGYQSDGKARYPIDTKEHCLAAWSYINQAKNADKYTAEQLASIKKKIKAALKKYGVDVEAKSFDIAEVDVEVLMEFDVESSVEEPGETTPQEREADVEATEPTEITRVRPSDAELAKSRLALLKNKLRQAA